MHSRSEKSSDLYATCSFVSAESVPPFLNLVHSSVPFGFVGTGRACHGPITQPKRQAQTFAKLDNQASSSPFWPFNHSSADTIYSEQVALIVGATICSRSIISATTKIDSLLNLVYLVDAARRTRRRMSVVQSLERAILQQYSPIVLSGPSHLQADSEVRKSLNISRAYANHLRLTLGEHIQNFLDQCKVGATGLERKVVWGDQLQHLEGNGLKELKRPGQDFVAVVGMHPESQKWQAVGFCARFQEHGRRVVVLKNYGSQLKMDHMQLGTSTKKNNADLAGEHASRLCDSV